MAKSFKPHKNHLPLIGGAVFIVLFAVVGIHILFSSHAASNTTSGAPTSPPVQVCGNSSLLTGPSTAPTGAVTIAAGLDSGTYNTPNTTYYFAAGTHYLSPVGGSWANYQYYQIIPGNNDTYIGAPGAILDGQGVNDFAFTQQATGVTVEYLTIENFGTSTDNTTQNNNEGVVNHDAGSNWTIEHNTVEDNAGAGVFLGSGDTVEYNCLTENGQYGFSSYIPLPVYPSNINLSYNEISYNDTYNWEKVDPGCGCDGGGKFWATNGITFTNNYDHDNQSVGVWLDTDNANANISDNYFSNNFGEAIMYEISYNGNITDNTFVHNTVGLGEALGGGFPASAIYISESGSDSRVPGPYSGGFNITGNVFTDNWGGVVLWENSNRFCGAMSPDNAGPYCTLVNPSVATAKTCDSSAIDNPPLFSDCRWKTQNLNVSDNSFSFTPSAVSSSCSASNGCGYNGVFSEFGSDSPYTAWIVPTNIANNQNNHFSDNTYTGPWSFMGPDQGVPVTWAEWTNGYTDNADGSGIHFNPQDAGSTYNGGGGTIAPTVPTNVTATANSSTSVTVTWSPSTPSSGTTLGGYYVLRDGTTVDTVTAPATKLIDTSVSGNTTYSYTIEAFDTAKPTPDVSSPSAPAKVTTPPGNGVTVIEDKTFEDGTDNMAAWYGDNVAQSNAKAHTGSFSLAVTGTGGGWGVQENWPGNATVSAGSQYNFSAWVLAGSTPEAISEQANWIDNSSSSVGTSTIGTVTDKSSGWTEITGTATAPANATSVALAFTSGAGTSGEVHYLDDLIVSTGSGTPPNNTPPSIPANVTATANSATSVTVNWGASKAASGNTLAGYYVIRGDTTVGTANASATSFTDLSVVGNTTYTYTVEAYDNVGNVSDPSAGAPVTTPNPGDTNPPTPPTKLIGTAVSSSQVTLSWMASNSSVGIANYLIYRNGTQVGTACQGSPPCTATSYGDTGLSPSTTYSYDVIAVDVDGNKSQPSSTIKVTTLAPTTTATIMGVVTDKLTGSALIGAYVHTGYHGTATGMTYADTNSSGQYALNNVIPSPATHSFYFSEAGYAQKDLILSFPSGNNTQNVNLNPITN